MIYYSHLLKFLPSTFGRYALKAATVRRVVLPPLWRKGSRQSDVNITLQPIAIVAFTTEIIYAPSRLRKPKTMSYQDFLRYADYGLGIQVSFEPDGKSNPQNITAYGVGCDCWYIIGGNVNQTDTERHSAPAGWLSD